MKKLVLAAIVLVTCVDAMARTCRTRINRYGETVRVCRGSDRGGQYDDGFFDGLIASTAILLTSDILNNGYKKDYVDSEIAMALAMEGQGVDADLSPELQEFVEQTRELNPEQELSDFDILEAYLLFNE